MLVVLIVVASAAPFADDNEEISSRVKRQWGWGNYGGWGGNGWGGGWNRGYGGGWGNGYGGWGNRGWGGWGWG